MEMDANKPTRKITSHLNKQSIGHAILIMNHFVIWFEMDKKKST